MANRLYAKVLLLLCLATKVRDKHIKQSKCSSISLFVPYQWCKTVRFRTMVTIELWLLIENTNRKQMPVVEPSVESSYALRSF